MTQLSRTLARRIVTAQVGDRRRLSDPRGALDSEFSLLVEVRSIARILLIGSGVDKVMPRRRGACLVYFAPKLRKPTTSPMHSIAVRPHAFHFSSSHALPAF